MLEAKIQSEIIQLMQKEKIFCHSVPNEAAGRSKVAQMQLVAMGLRKGVADLVVWWSHGIGYVEVKRPGGKQSVFQKHFEQMCIDAGFTYDLVYSVDDMKNLIYKYSK